MSFPVCPSCSNRAFKDAGLYHKTDCPAGIMEDAENMKLAGIHTQQGQLNAIDYLQRQGSWLNVKEKEILSSLMEQVDQRTLSAKQTRLLLDLCKRLQRHRQPPGTVSGGGGPGTGKRR